jgi:hypothetical protein
MQIAIYLGLVLNELLDYNITAKAVAASANRVLCLEDLRTDDVLN